MDPDKEIKKEILDDDVTTPLNTKLVEPKQEEPDDSDCVQNPIKLELVEPKIEEPDYIETSPSIFVEPRVEEPVENSVSDLEQPVYLKLETSEYPEIIEKITKIKSIRPRLSKLKCAVCSASALVKDTNRQASKTRQVLLLAGLVLCGRISVEKAQSLYSKCTFNSCKIHVLEAMEEIFRVLNIKNLQTRWTKEGMEKLMSMVNKLHPEHPFDRIYPLLLDFQRRADIIRQEEPSNFA